MYITICKIDNPRTLNEWSRHSKLVLWDNPEWWGEEGSGRSVQDGGAHVHPWLNHVDVWQKSPQYYKVISLQLKWINYDTALPLLGIHTEETRIERDSCTPMFIAALFIIARTWKQPRCPSADKWIRKQWYIYTMEYYSAIKKNTFESVLMRWMKLEPIIQSEISQKENTSTVY